MTGDGGLRRLLPPPRRRPGVLTVLVRWRIELLLLGGIVTAWYHAGATAVLVTVLMVALLATLIRPVGRVVLGVVLAVAVPHRVRSGLVQSGVVDRTGRPPWIVWPAPPRTRCCSRSGCGPERPPRTCGRRHRWSRPRPGRRASRSGSDRRGATEPWWSSTDRAGDGPGGERRWPARSARAPPDRRPSSATKRSSRHRINRQWPEPGTHDLNRGAWTCGRRSAALTASFGPPPRPGTSEFSARLSSRDTGAATRRPVRGSPPWPERGGVWPTGGF